LESGIIQERIAYGKKKKFLSYESYIFVKNIVCSAEYFIKYNADMVSFARHYV
jgi:hypothetical protein